MIDSAFIRVGGCSVAGGTLLPGWANRSFQAMGDSWPPAGDRRRCRRRRQRDGRQGPYLGTVAGVIVITLLQSIFWVLQLQQRLAELG